MRDEVLSVLREFVGQANILAVPALFVRLCGDASAAILLNQILYWSERATLPDGWFYKSKREWEQELGITPRILDRCQRELIELGVIETKLAGLPAVTHYRTSPAFFGILIDFIAQTSFDKTSKLVPTESDTLPLTEITQETTTNSTPSGEPDGVPVNLPVPQKTSVPGDPIEAARRAYDQQQRALNIALKTNQHGDGGDDPDAPPHTRKTHAPLSGLEARICQINSSRTLTDGQRNRLNQPFRWPVKGAGAIGLNELGPTPVELYDNAKHPAHAAYIDYLDRMYAATIAQVRGRTPAGRPVRIRPDGLVTTACQFVPLHLEKETQLKGGALEEYSLPDPPGSATDTDGDDDIGISALELHRRHKAGLDVS